MQTENVLIEYVWIGGNYDLRSKIKVMYNTRINNISDILEEGFNFSPRFAVNSEKKCNESDLLENDFSGNPNHKNNEEQAEDCEEVPLKIHDVELDDSDIIQANFENLDDLFISNKFGINAKKDFGKKMKHPKVIFIAGGNELGKYVGETNKNNDEHGHGTLYWDDKKTLRYMGEWKNGKREGNGISYWPNGKNLYVGSWKDGDYSGFGTEFNMNNHPVYRGDWKKGLYNGKGKLYNKDAEVIAKGIWEDNILVEAQLTKEQKNKGYEVKSYLNTNNEVEIYIGQTSSKKKESTKSLHGDEQLKITKNLRHGKGVHFGLHASLSEIGRLEGYWVNDQSQGNGSIYDKNNDLVYDGEFHQGQINGVGTSYYNNGNKEYDGQWKDSMSNGFGISFYEDGSIEYQGYWKNDMKHGKGISFYENGYKEYNGCWANDYKNGLGVSYFERMKDVKQYEGDFYNNMKDGRGKLYNYNGREIFVGQFRNDNYVE